MSNMKVVFMEISSSVEFQSQAGCVVRGALLPEEPGYLWFHSPLQVLHPEFPSSAFSPPRIISIRFPFLFLSLKHLEMFLIASSK